MVSIRLFAPVVQVLCVDPGSGEILRSFGQNLMMMPHSILVEPDSMGATAFIWLTDVGLHQVLKLDAVTGEVVLRLGEEKVPGKTQARLCKPSGVALYRGSQLELICDFFPILPLLLLQ